MPVIQPNRLIFRGNEQFFMGQQTHLNRPCWPCSFLNIRERYVYIFNQRALNTKIRALKPVWSPVCFWFRFQGQREKQPCPSLASMWLSRNTTTSARARHAPSMRASLGVRLVAESNAGPVTGRVSKLKSRVTQVLVLFPT